jgi:hypothetical protein
VQGVQTIELGRTKFINSFDHPVVERLLDDAPGVAAVGEADLEGDGVVGPVLES